MLKRLLLIALLGILVLSACVAPAPAQWQQQFNDLPRGPATLSDAELAAHRLPELPAAWIAAIEQGWQANVLQR